MRSTRRRFLVFILCVALGMTLTTLMEEYLLPHLAQFGLNWYALERFALPILYVIGLAVWAVSIERRVDQRTARSLLILNQGILILWIVVRVVKYNIDHPTIIRYLWYMYYIPLLFVPTLFFLTSFYLGREDEFHIDRRVFLWLIPSVLLFLLVATNDLHGMVFRIPDLNNTDVYSYGPGYFMVSVWIMIMILGSLGNIFTKSHVGVNRQYLKYPGLVLLVGIAYSAIYVGMETVLSYGPAIDLAYMFCGVYVCLGESLIITGFLPTNSRHVLFFNASSLSAYITDAKGAPVAVPAGVEMLSETEMESLRRDGIYQPVEESEYHLYEIPTGQVVYRRDLSEVMELVEELQDAGDALQEDHIIKEKTAQTESMAVRLAEKEHLYRQIQEGTHLQSERIRTNLEKIRGLENPAEEQKLWQENLVLGVYMKRYSNLLLLQENRGHVSSEELRLAFGQSVEALEMMGVHAGVLVRENYPVPSVFSLYVYHMFEMIVEWKMERLQRIHVVLSCREEKHTCLIETGAAGGFYGLEKNLEREAQNGGIAFGYDLDLSEDQLHVVLQFREEAWV